MGSDSARERSRALRCRLHEEARSPRAPCLRPSQLLLFELLRRPIESAQYTSIAFGNRCREAGVRPSMGTVGDAYDNALCESFFATLECELLDRQRFRTQVEARLAIFDFIEGWYNSRRRHSALDYRSPTIFERSKERDDRTAPAGSTIDQGGAISISPPRPCGEQSRKQFTVHRTGATPLRRLQH